MRSFGLYVNGQYVHSGALRDAVSPAEGRETFARAAFLEASNDDGLSEAALEGAHQTFRQIQAGFFPLNERLAWLERFRQKVLDNTEFLSRLVATEVGKPIKLARLEVSRIVSTVEWTLHEAPRALAGEKFNADCRPAWAGLDAWTSREPRGPLLAISPFNYPLNLAIHKIIPAIAAGCPVILKPSPKAAVSALGLADSAHAAQLPAGMLSVLNADNAVTAKLAGDPRIAQISFTGSAKVGWQLARDHAEKPVYLELGGTAPVFVDEGVDVSAVAEKVVTGGMAYAGQVCISVQNVWCKESIAPKFRRALIEKMERLAWGRLLDENTVAGCVIDTDAAKRLLALRASAEKVGARAIAEASPTADLSVGEIEKAGTFVRPAIFENVPLDHAMVREEIFGPYINFFTAPDFDAFEKIANAAPFRFQAAVFTNDMKLAHRAARSLQYGAVLINEPTSLRLEPMPFGGRGLSGNSREGPRYAMQDYTELKTVVMRS